MTTALDGRRRVLVAGGSGMLGREVARVLSADARVEVIVAARDSGLRFDAEAGPDIAGGLLEQAPRVDVVVNSVGVLSSMIDRYDPRTVRRAILVNGAFPQSLALAAAERGARMIHVSSDGVLRNDAGRCQEDSTDFASDIYGTTKRLGEPLLESAISLRCSVVGTDVTKGRGLLEWCRRQTG
jgi:dTDP-4-dehydrorhamnose reductase